ncbi:hypothetical protein E1298_41080 [Actinomadura rubrisoli]|uniref:Uncharacterized protein n=2 Tax=Actinomadura rubrisoli TaxID=2530368 RepID=A0A4R5A2Q9_9ACTN|nr:hypothetical protein E1298_41080 [Actinomadura rubrisoli]
MVVLQDRPVIALSAALAEALDECERTGRTLQIVTDHHSRVTVPVRTMVTAKNAQWVVHDGSGYYEALTGHPMHWDGKSFARVPDASDYAPAYLTRPTAPIGSQLVLTFQAHHTPQNPLGGQVDHFMRLLTGQPPIGWGATEPLEHLWDPQALTTHILTSNAPRLIAVGGGRRPAMATLEFTGTTELTTLTIGYKPDDPPPVAQVPSLIDVLTSENPITSLLAQLTPGRPDLTTEPRWSGASAPIGLAATGSYTGPPGFMRQRIGPPTTPLTWFHLGDGTSPEYWQRHQQLLHHLRNP